jgi:meiotically up-regulated gene 157 (Mug157) protein
MQSCLWFVSGERLRISFADDLERAGGKRDRRANPSAVFVTRPFLAGIIVASLVSAIVAPAMAACPPGFVEGSPQLVSLYFAAYNDVLTQHATTEPDGTVYVSTGDIHAEWLRDSSAVAQAYIKLAKHEPDAARTLRGIIARQAKYITIDPYANAFNPDYTVFERKFELDSLMYPVWLAYLYWRGTGDASIFTAQQQRAFDAILGVMRTEQYHDQRSTYRGPGLPNGGKGSPVAYTGMVWSGYRPSDDPCIYGYLIPDNMLAVVVMRNLATIEQQVYHDGGRSSNASNLSSQIAQGIERYGNVRFDGSTGIYAYEVDGYGHTNMMDDANVPSLLAIPYFGYLPVNDPRYQRTRGFVLSSQNPYYFTGTYAKGVGSPHTPHGWIWPMALVVQAMTSQDPAETALVLSYLSASDDPTQFTRTDFAWPNALFIELISAMKPESRIGPQGRIECFQGVVAGEVQGGT